MEFIDGGVDGRDKEANGEGTVDSRLSLAKHPEEKRGEDRVLSQMCAFADNELDRRNCCNRNAGSEPAE